MNQLEGSAPILLLVAVQDLVNLASCVRIAKNFGVSRIRLIRPECPVDFYRIEGVAHNTADLLEQMTVHNSLDEAAADLTTLYALTGRERSSKRRALRPKEAAPELVELSLTGPVGILAGREDSGLTNDELDRCSALVTISAEPSYSSLNLAQAWAVMAHELWVARGGDRLPFKAPRRKAPPATHQQLEELFQDWEAALGAIDFFKKREPEQVMRGFRELIYRARPDARETALLRAAGLEIGHFLRRNGIPAPGTRVTGNLSRMEVVRKAGEGEGE